MARLTMEEFEGHEDSRWAKELASRQGIVAAFMVEFTEAGFLGGPFAEKYALVTIRDHTNRPGPSPLKTETQIYNDVRKMAANSLSKFPRQIAQRAGVESEQEYISGRHYIETGAPAPIDESNKVSRFFMTRNTLGGSATLDHPHLQVSQNGRSDVDALDVVRIAREMAYCMSKEDLIEALNEIERKIEAQMKFYLDYEARSEPSIEKPFQLTLHGNDDSSWSRVFATLDEALVFADEIEANADVQFVNDQLSFTN